MPTYPESNDEFLIKESFKCTSCGECCRPIVVVSEDDIKKIELTGLKRQNFISHDFTQKDINFQKLLNEVNKGLEILPEFQITLVQENGVCIFLKKDQNKKDQGHQGKFICSIYNHRPATCKNYPFIQKSKKLTDCRPPRWKYWAPLKILVRK
ncbi:YkgJ family cysteine cluster protein [archaeon]|jgi:Fe-S-cluster containining protein|nr:YkgJ family cysteine cluster protein [archaeon]MBT6697866.1 YkgJ family cysteine cluster protein [archaeon]